MGDIATDVTLGCATPESLSQLLPPSELLKRPSSDVPTYTVSGSFGSTARHRAPRSSRVSSTPPFSMTATALSAAAYRRLISEPPFTPSQAGVVPSSTHVLVSAAIRSVCYCSLTHLIVCATSPVIICTAL